MGDDTINPFFGISKELNVQFCLGYDPMEFNESLRVIAEGDIDVPPMITGELPLEGVADALAALRNPDAHSQLPVPPSTPPPHNLRAHQPAPTAPPPTRMGQPEHARDA